MPYFSLFLLLLARNVKVDNRKNFFPKTLEILAWKLKKFNFYQFYIQKMPKLKPKISQKRQEFYLSLPYKV